MDTCRTFIAIELPEDLRARIVQHIARLRGQLPAVRASWSREENLHLTLKFLGNVPVANVPKVSDAVERATKAISAFELTLAGCGTFPPHGPPSVLWIGAGSEDSSLRDLHAAIEAELTGLGFPCESRPFQPHLTLARLRHGKGARQLAELHRSLEPAPVKFAVSEIMVFRSELHRQGSKHTAISRHRLA